MNICIQHSASFCGFLNCRRCCFSGLLSDAEARELLGHGVPELGVGHCVHDRVDAARCFGWNNIKPYRIYVRKQLKFLNYNSHTQFTIFQISLQWLCTHDARDLTDEGREVLLEAERGHGDHRGVRRPDAEPQQHVRDGHLAINILTLVISYPGSYGCCLIPSRSSPLRSPHSPCPTSDCPRSSSWPGPWARPRAPPRPSRWSCSRWRWGRGGWSSWRCRRTIWRYEHSHPKLRCYISICIRLELFTKIHIIPQRHFS